VSDPSYDRPLELPSSLRAALAAKGKLPPR